MASSLEENLRCSICLDIYSDPVVLSCSHSFCRLCLRSCWSDRAHRECPLCRTKAKAKDPPPNLALRNVCEAYLQAKDLPPSAACRLHHRELSLFCSDHQVALCEGCRVSGEHMDHSLCSVREAVKQQQRELLKALLRLESRLRLLAQTELEFGDADGFISAQAKDTEKLIQEQFQKLHRFLQEEEESRVRAVREEEEQKRKRLKDKMAALSREKTAVAKTISETKTTIQGFPKDQVFISNPQPLDLSLLLRYKSLVELVQRPLQEEEPQLGSGALLDQAQHLGNLGFHIWTSLRSQVQYSPVVLDPDTASTDLSLSGDLSSVALEVGPKFPQNPERLRSCYWSVLGSRGLAAGVHSWDVDVSQNQHWELGVASKSQKLVGVLSEMWTIRRCQDRYEAGTLTGTPTVLSVPQSPQTVRVVLDLDRGDLSFYDQDSHSLIHSFTRSFTGDNLFPYFFTGDSCPLRLLPLSSEAPPTVL